MNFETWPGLTYSNAANYCPHTVETIKGHMVQSVQGVLSTKKMIPAYRGLKKGISKVSPEEEEEMGDITPPIKKKNYIFGINQSVSCIMMLVVAFQLGPGVATSTL